MPSFPASSVPIVLTPQALDGDNSHCNLTDFLISEMLHEGHDWDDLPADVSAVYALSSYIGNVWNGGHSQFVHNAFQFFEVGPLRMLQGAELAALVFGLPQTLGVIGRVREWIIANPDEAQQQTGFSGGRAEALEPLDDALFEADMVDEAGWLAILAPLGPEVAARLAGEMGYRDPKYPLKFPQSRFDLHEAVFWLKRQPRVIVEEEDFPAAVAALSAVSPTGTLQ